MSVLSQSALAVQASQSEFVIVGTHVDSVRGPSTIFNVISDCSTSMFCSALATAVSNSTGVPLDKAVTVVLALTPQRSGRGTYVTMALPSGYSYCSSSMKLTSIVQRDGPRGSLFLGRADPNSFYFETWTPVLGLGEGRSWVEGDLAVVGVRDDLASAAYSSGRCHSPNRAIFYCRGGGCEGGAIDTGRRGSASPGREQPQVTGRVGWLMGDPGNLGSSETKFVELVSAFHP